MQSPGIRIGIGKGNGNGTYLVLQSQVHAIAAFCEKVQSSSQHKELLLAKWFPVLAFILSSVHGQPHCEVYFPTPVFSLVGTPLCFSLYLQYSNTVQGRSPEMKRTLERVIFFTRWEFPGSFAPFASVGVCQWAPLHWCSLSLGEWGPKCPRKMENGKWTAFKQHFSLIAYTFMDPSLDWAAIRSTEHVANAWDGNTDLMVTGWPALSPEPQLLNVQHTITVVTHVKLYGHIDLKCFK